MTSLRAIGLVGLAWLTLGCEPSRNADDDGTASARAADPPAPAMPPSAAPAPSIADGIENIRLVVALRSIELTIAAHDGDVLRTSGCDPATQKLSGDGGLVTVVDRSCLRCDLLRAGDPAPGRSALILRDFAKGLSRYPQSYLQAAELRGVTLCRRIQRDAAASKPEEKAVEGMLIGGTIDRARRMLMLSIEPMGLSGEDIVHHELFHLFDYMANTMTYVDSPWSDLNRPAAAHADAGAGGFLNEHARINVLEDKATVFQFLMARPQALCDQMALDPILAAKVALMRKRLQKRIPADDARALESTVPCLVEQARAPAP